MTPFFAGSEIPAYIWPFSRKTKRSLPLRPWVHFMADDREQPGALPCPCPSRHLLTPVYIKVLAQQARHGLACSSWSGVHLAAGAKSRDMLQKQCAHQWFLRPPKKAF